MTKWKEKFEERPPTRKWLRLRVTKGAEIIFLQKRKEYYGYLIEQETIRG